MPMGARYYDPNLGRFLQRDPLLHTLARSVDLHMYAYALNNPLRYADPTRLDEGEFEITNPNELSSDPVISDNIQWIQ